jgi:hypothetical protein
MRSWPGGTGHFAPPADGTGEEDAGGAERTPPARG